MSARGRDFNSFTDKFYGIVNHYHGAVFEIADSLIFSLAFLDKLNCHLLSGQSDRPEVLGEFVDVQNGDVLDSRDLAEVIVGRLELGVEFKRQGDQFIIDRLDVRIVLG